MYRMEKLGFPMAVRELAEKGLSRLDVQSGAIDLCLAPPQLVIRTRDPGYRVSSYWGPT